jgi:EAL domain-containing protein (putative c-di-GMP-specific phosphodiesterase class I)
VKIDRAFVTGISRQRANHVIIRCIIALARERDMRVTPKGWRTKANCCCCCRRPGCNLIQCYHFGRPMPADAIPDPSASRMPVLRIA